MKLRTTILIRIGLLISTLALALSGTFYWIFARDVKQRTQQTMEATFSLLEESVQRKQREMARETEKLNFSIRAALKNVATARRITPPREPEAKLAWLKNLMKQTAALADHLYTLSESLGRDGMQIALYDQNGNLLMLYISNDILHLTTALYLSEIKQDALIIQRQKTVFVGDNKSKVTLDEHRLNHISDTADLESIPIPSRVNLKVSEEVLSGRHPVEQFTLLNEIPALQYDAPIHGVLPSVDYFIQLEHVAKPEPNNGLISLSVQIRTGEIQRIAAMTRTNINV